jgi:hypothetical protein
MEHPKRNHQAISSVPAAVSNGDGENASGAMSKMASSVKARPQRERSFVKTKVSDSAMRFGNFFAIYLIQAIMTANKRAAV